MSQLRIVLFWGKNADVDTHQSFHLFVFLDPKESRREHRQQIYPTTSAINATLVFLCSLMFSGMFLIFIVNWIKPVSITGYFFPGGFNWLVDSFSAESYHGGYEFWKAIPPPFVAQSVDWKTGILMNFKINVKISPKVLDMDPCPYLC